MRFSSWDDLKRDRAVENHHRAQVLHADVRHVAVVGGIGALVRDTDDDLSTSSACTRVHGSTPSSASSGAWIGEPTDQRLMLVFMIS